MAVNRPYFIEEYQSRVHFGDTERLAVQTLVQTIVTHIVTYKPQN